MSGGEEICARTRVLTRTRHKTIAGRVDRAGFMVTWERAAKNRGVLKNGSGTVEAVRCGKLFAEMPDGMLSPTS